MPIRGIDQVKETSCCIDFFCDISVAAPLVDALHVLASEHKYSRLLDHFPGQPDLKDDIWIPYCGKNNLTVLTCDQKIAGTNHRKRLIRESNAQLIVFVSIAHRSPLKQAAFLFERWEGAIQVYEDNPGIPIVWVTKTDTKPKTV